MHLLILVELHHVLAVCQSLEVGFGRRPLTLVLLPSHEEVEVLIDVRLLLVLHLLHFDHLPGGFTVAVLRMVVGTLVQLNRLDLVFVTNVVDESP